MNRRWNSFARRRLVATAVCSALALGLGTPTQAAGAAAKPAQPTKPAVDLRYVWDLTPLFASDADWDATRKQAVTDADALPSLKTDAGRDATQLAAALNKISSVKRTMDRVLVYAYLNYSTDTRDASAQERWSLAQAAQGNFGAGTAWLAPLVQGLGKDTVEAWIAREPALKNHAVALRDMVRLAAHTKSAETEAALAGLAPVLGGFSDAANVLTNTDIAWPTIKLPNGKKVTLNAVGYGELRQHPDRKVRMQAFDAFWKTYSQFTNTLGNTLGAVVNADIIDAKLRGYPSAVAAALSPNDIPESIYRTLVAETNNGLPTLHRYFKLRQRLLKLPDSAYYDIYPSVVSLKKTFDVPTSQQLTLAAVAPLGKDYTEALGGYFKQRATHVYPSEGKDSGAYHWHVYGGIPYVFLNHKDDYESMTTIAHEWGHAMHSHLADRAQPYETADYPLFLAEIASTTNEALLADTMIAHAKTPNEKLYYIGMALEGLRGTFFRQAMFAEFELATHDTVQRGEALSGKRMTELYCDLLKRYHGDKEGVVKIDPAYCSEWAFIPHFYRPFYVYQYATSISAGVYFAADIAKRGEAGVDNYLTVLRSGNSVAPDKLLKAAGLDMSSPVPYQALIKRMNDLLDMAEAIVNKPAS